MNPVHSCLIALLWPEIGSRQQLIAMSHDCGCCVERNSQPYSLFASTWRAMIFEFGKASGENKWVVLLLMVSRYEQEAMCLAKKLESSSQYFMVNWIKADLNAAARVTDLAINFLPSAPTVIVIDFASFQEGFLDVFQDVRSRLSSRQIEYMIINMKRQVWSKFRINEPNISIMFEPDSRD